jgi:hypothetical protein
MQLRVGTREQKLARELRPSIGGLFQSEYYLSFTFEGRREGGDRGHAARAAAPRVPATMPHLPRRLEPKRLALALKKVSFHTSILQLQSGAAAANART